MTYLGQQFPKPQPEPKNYINLGGMTNAKRHVQIGKRHSNYSNVNHQAKILTNSNIYTPRQEE